MRIPVRTLVVRLVLVTGACGLLGAAGVLDPAHAVLLGLLGVAAVVLNAVSVEEVDAEWPGRPFTSRAGGRSGVSDLSWQVFGRDRRVRDNIVERVATLAAARLALLGVDAADPTQSAEVDRLLGAAVSEGIASRRPPTARTLQTWLDAIDRLSGERTTP